MKKLLLAAVAVVGLAAVAHADPIITFGQTSNSNTTNGVASSTGTTITSNNTLVSISQIENSTALPGSFPFAFLDLTATSLVGGATVLGGAIVEHFNGVFSVTSAINGGGTNYLSGTFSDAAITSVGSTQIGIFAPTASFTSSEISVLGLPRSIGFTLTNVNPPPGTGVSTVACSGCTSGLTINSFSSSIAGNASATGVPEPASMALLGVGLLGLGMVAHRKRT